MSCNDRVLYHTQDSIPYAQEAEYTSIPARFFSRATLTRLYNAKFDVDFTDYNNIPCAGVIPNGYHRYGSETYGRYLKVLSVGFERLANGRVNATMHGIGPGSIYSGNMTYAEFGKILAYNYG